MRRSIKHQFTFIFIGLMAGTLLICWIINNFFLEQYYEDRRKKDLVQTYEMMNKTLGVDARDLESFDIVLQQNSERYNIMGAVQDSNAKVLITFGNDVDMLKGILWDWLYKASSVHMPSGKNYQIQKTYDVRTNMDYLEMVGWLDNQQAFFLRTPLENIRESVNIANQFLIYAGVICVFLSSVIIFIITRRMTAPIVELNEISKRMTKLDFEAKYTGKSKNEIGLLGENINTLSEALEKNIRELKTANNELKKDIAQKELAENRRKEFLSNVSHELKTPIAIIQGYAEGLKDCVNEDEESRIYYSEVIMDEAIKMNAMVKQLMNLNELESGKDNVNFERFDIVSLIHNYMMSAGILAKERGIDVRITQEESIYVWADELKTEEVFSNYFTNAVNHCGDEKIIDIKLEQKENLVRVIVFNTGKKIPEESLSMIWDKFYKVDKARTREYGGSGVGLSIVKAVMESMNQAYGVENFENGVAFWFELETVERV